MKKYFKNKSKIILLALIIISLVMFIRAIGKHYKFSYVKNLSENKEYRGELARPKMTFNYALASDTNLVYLRKKYKLDSIAGNGTEIERIINLMWWVHGLSPHASNPTWPKTVNSHNIIDLCLNENKSINCYMYSVVLNEVYLAMGFYSRFIQMRYVVPGESHVVNAVYSETLNKWIMMDANHGAYFMDENSNILSLPEIRNKIINKEQIVFNKELEYEGSVGAAKFVSRLFGIENFYRWYFSKNIFKYETVVNNKFDILTDRTADKIQLVPSDYLSKINTSKKKGIYERADFYYTDNEEFFWQSPLKSDSLLVKL